MHSILDCVDLQPASKFTENDDILVSQFTSYAQFRGLYEFSKIESRFKLLVFYDESLPASVVYKLQNYPNVIICKTSTKSPLYRYIPIIKSELKFNHAYICDIGISRFYWRNTILSFEKIIQSGSQLNTYILPLAGELMDENLNLESQFALNTWHRLSPDHIIIKKGNEFPQEILDNTFLSDESEYYLTLSMMQHIQDNNISFDYQILIFGNRVPLYYWLEHVNPSEEKKAEFMTRMGVKTESIESYIKAYEYQKRKELYSAIRKNFGDYSFFENQRLIACIKRFNLYFRNSDQVLYCKKW